MEHLNSETFKSLQELAEVQRQLATAQAEIEALRSTKNTFLAEREAEVLSIVDNVLTASRVALSEADKNRDAIASLLAVVTEVVKDAGDMQKIQSEIIESYNEATSNTISSISTKTKELDRAIHQIKSERILIEDEKRSLQIARDAIRRDRILIEDRKQMLQTELNRISTKKI